MTDARREPCSGVSVIHQDAALLVLNKPSGLATTSPDGTQCLAACARALDRKAERMHASSRLDAEVTGVVTFARTSRAIEDLLSARRTGRYERYYLALAARAPDERAGQWQFPIDRDPRDARRRVIVKPPRGTPAHTRFRVLASQPTAVLLLLMPQTGRTHQLRVHAAHVGSPLLGDRHYGAAMQQVLPDGRVIRAKRVMLHCARVRLPARGASELVAFDAPVPSDFSALWQQLGGTTELLQPAAWMPASEH